MNIHSLFRNQRLQYGRREKYPAWLKFIDREGCIWVTKFKRQLLRFSVPTLLLVMLVVCVALVWKVSRASKQPQAGLTSLE